MMLRMSTTMDRSFMETAASRARCGRDTRSVLWLRSHWLLPLEDWAHLDVLSGPHGPDRLQVLVAAAQHHAHGVVTLGDLRQSLGVAQSPASVARRQLTQKRHVLKEDKPQVISIALTRFGLTGRKSDTLSPIGSFLTLRITFGWALTFTGAGG